MTPMPRTLGLLLLALALFGCERPSKMEVASNLVAKFPFAEATNETRVVELGPQAASLGEGWSYPETSSGQTFRWAHGARSEVVFTALEARELAIVLRAVPYLAAGETERSLAVEVNGAGIGSVTLGAEPATYRIQVPAESVHSGVNWLVLLPERWRPQMVGRPGDTETRALSIAVLGLAIDGLASSRPPSIDVENELLLLADGSRVDYFLDLAPGSVLAIERTERRGPGTAELEIAVAFDGEETAEVLRASGTAGETLVPLLARGEQRRRAARVSFAVAPPTAARQTGTTVVRSPRVLAPARPEPVAAERAARVVERANLLLVLVDTLRDDHLGAYGYERPVSPHFDHFADSAVVFENARAQASWTRAAVASIFTSLWPGSHGVNRNRGPSQALAADAVTLAEVLSEAGYETAGIYANPNVDAQLGYGQGFDHYAPYLAPDDEVEDVLDAAFDWLDGWQERASGRPFFLYLHTMDPHSPYLPPEEMIRRFAPEARPLVDEIRANPDRENWTSDEATIRGLLGLYDGEIASHDEGFGRLLAELERSELSEETLIVLISDHGEEFYEHGAWNHGRNLHRETVNVPFAMRLPGDAQPQRIAEPVSHVDLMPTLLDYLGIPAPTAIEGTSLRALIERGEPLDRPIFLHTQVFTPLNLGVILGDWKLVERRDPRGTVRRLYHWREDREELRDLAADYPIQARAMGGLLEERLARPAALVGDDVVIDDELAGRLRALGYLD
jgi:arylsulfatase A-like enzyme